MSRRFAILLSVMVFLLACWVGYTRFSSQPTSASASFLPKKDGSRIYFVPVGDFPREQLQPLVDYYRKRYRLEIAVLKNIPVDPALRDESRQQLKAEELAASVRSSVAEYANDPDAILIGFTSDDIYPTSQDWQFAFGWRVGSSRSAVVSTARMNLTYDGAPANSSPETRLRKIVSKDIGILYYGLPQSTNPSSVLYNQILGVQELDRVGEDF